jgi:hypothetical protein
MVILIPLIIGYFVATSDAFIKKVILPRVSKAMDAQITVADTSIHPFSSAVLHGVKVQTTGSEPLATVQEARVHYSLWSILGGNIKVSDMTLVSPVLQVITNPDGTSNLDPLMKKKEKPEKPSKGEKKPSKPPQVDIGQVQIQNGLLRMVQLHSNGKRDVKEVSDLNLKAANVKNGQNGSAEIAGRVLIDNNPPAAATNGMLAGTLDGKLNFALSKTLEPESIKGGLQTSFLKGAGAMAELGGLGATVECDVAPNEVKQLALKFRKNESPLGEIRAYGPLSLATQEGKLNVEVLSIDRQVLNLVGAEAGMDFGQTKINSTNQIELAKKGNVITAAGALNVNQFTLTRTNQSTPPLDLSVAYNVSVNRPQQNALVRMFTLKGTQNQKPILSSELTSPMNVAWGETTQNIPDSALKVMVTDFDFADWKAFLGEIAPAGKLNGTLNLASQQGGKRLTFDLASRAEGVTAKLGTNAMPQVTLQLQAKGQASDLKMFTLDNYRAEVARAGKPMALLSGAGTYDKAKEEADVNATLEGHLASLAKAIPNSKLKVSSGTVVAKLQLAQKQQAQSVVGNMVVEQLNAVLGTNVIQSFAANLELDVQKNASRMEIRKATGTLRQGNNPGGSFDAKGSFDSERKSGEIGLKLVDLNQNVLRPFLEPALQGKQLVSVAINADASAKFAGESDSAVKGNLQVGKLVVNDPAKRIAATPLEAKVQLDAAMAKQRLDLRMASLTLSPTQRAKNEAQLKGQVDLSQAKAIQGKLNLFADSLDLTPYYDLVTAEKPKKKPEEDDEAPEVTPSAPQADPGAEPPAKKLPFRDVTADLKVNNLYLREVHVSNWVASAKIEGSRVALEPMQLAINGRPVSGKVHLDLGVPGYKYEVALKADGIPIPPIANSFMPEYRAKQGNVFADIVVNGAGTKGVSLQKSLTGQLTMNCTNAQIEVLPKFLRRTAKAVSTVLRIPEIRTAPMTGFSGNIQLGEGKIDIKNLDITTAAFAAHVEGAIPIGKVLTNSPLPKIPVALALKRSLAEKANVMPANTAPDAEFVPLGTFVRLTGTLGQPKPDVDKVRIAAILAQSQAHRIGGSAGKILEGLAGNVLGGGKPNTNAPAGTTNAPTGSTNAPAATNQPSGGLPGILDIFKRSKEKK